MLLIKSNDRNIFDDCFYVLIKRILKLKLAILYSNLVCKVGNSANLMEKISVRIRLTLFPCCYEKLKPRQRESFLTGRNITGSHASLVCV